MKAFGLVLVFLFSFVPTFGQKKITAKRPLPKCNLTLKDSPKLRDFYLGQSAEEISQIIPNFKQVYNDSAEKVNFYKNLEIDFRIVGLYEIAFLNQSAVEDYNDVSITWHFYDGKLVRLFVRYTEFEAVNLKNFIKQVTEKTSLPINSFKIVSKHKAVATCNGFTIELNEGEYTRVGWFSSSPQVVLTDTEAESRLEKAERDFVREQKVIRLREKQEKDRKRGIFKP